MTFHWRLLTLPLLCLTLAPSHSASALDATVRVEGGQLEGVAGADPNVRVFKGVPYAAPPVGNLRWKPPQPALPWSGVRSAAEYGPACPQVPDPTLTFLGLKAERTSEDCLYLNIWTAAKAASERRPVMVWIHGGGFVNGSGSFPLYNGEKLAKQGVVLVTINYRLGPLGFFALPELSKESPHNVSGNYGLLDQIAALKWVKRNIAAFGGDPGRVTVFGESAGAMSVGYLMASTQTRGLFQRAIAESGSPFATNEALRGGPGGGLEGACERMARKLVGEAPGGMLAALRERSAQEIVHGLSPTSEVGLNGGVRLAPVVDGWVLPADPVRIFEARKEQPVPLIVGTNADEGTLFLMREGAAAGPEMFKSFVERRYGPDASAVMQLYPASTPEEYRAGAVNLLTDGLFLAGADFWARQQSRVSPTYVYRYDYVATGTRFASLGAFHGSEIPRVFGSLGPLRLTDDEDGRALTRAMMGAWVRFAATGDPNGDGLTEWPRFAPATDSLLELGRTIEVRSHVRQKQVDFFEKLIAGNRE